MLDLTVYNGRTVHLYHRGGQRAANKAMARVGEEGYNVLTKNCWHFSLECCDLGPTIGTITCGVVTGLLKLAVLAVILPFHIM